MRPTTLVFTLLAMQSVAPLGAVQAQVQRNPPGTETLGGPTRNPSNADAAPAERRDATPATPAAPDRPPLGSDDALQADQLGPPRTAPGHTLGVGPNEYGPNGTGTSPRAGGGAPSVINPNGSNAGAEPGPLSGSRPNDGSAENGSKAAPMQANGVRKVD